MGIQSLSNQTLQFFGRDHDVSDALQAIQTAQSLFNNISLDFIYARPGQTLKEWELELQCVLELGAQHLSLYQLMMERGTPLFKQMVNDQLAVISDDVSAEMYERTIEVLGLIVSL